jgi:hypothetical protein
VIVRSVPVVDGPVAAPARPSRAGRCFCDDLLHEEALGLGVGAAIVAQAGGQGALEVAVGVGQTRVGAEGVAEGEMPAQRGSADGADVQVMGWCAGRGGEGFTARDSEVAFGVVAEGRSRWLTARSSTSSAIWTGR